MIECCLCTCTTVGLVSLALLSGQPGVKPLVLIASLTFIDHSWEDGQDIEITCIYFTDGSKFNIVAQCNYM